MLFTRIKTHAFFMFIVKTLITAIDKHELIDYQYVKHSPDDMQTSGTCKSENFVQPFYSLRLPFLLDNSILSQNYIKVVNF